MIIFKTVSCAAFEKMLLEDKQDATDVGSVDSCLREAIASPHVKYTIFSMGYVMLRCLYVRIKFHVSTLKYPFIGRRLYSPQRATTTSS
ncbi:hypothetical protein Hanom_Chr14g01299451 [Helianthus anomalus]